jgi:hypothetical protein
MTSEDLNKVQELVAEICRISGHGEIIIRVRDGDVVLLDFNAQIVPPSRRLSIA